MEEKKKKKFFSLERIDAKTRLSLSWILAFLSGQVREAEMKYVPLDGATIKLIFYTTLSSYKHPVASWFLFYCENSLSNYNIQGHKAMYVDMYYKKSETFIAIP